jgi:hypothetical protein
VIYRTLLLQPPRTLSPDDFAEWSLRSGSVGKKNRGSKENDRDEAAKPGRCTLKPSRKKTKPRVLMGEPPKTNRRIAEY